jgi:hypothetical protein
MQFETRPCKANSEGPTFIFCVALSYQFTGNLFLAHHYPSSYLCDSCCIKIHIVSALFENHESNIGCRGQSEKVHREGSRDAI